MLFHSRVTFLHLPGALFPQECRVCGAMPSAELLPQFPLTPATVALRQGRQLVLPWLSRQERSPAPPPHLTRANIFSPHHHPCDPSTFQPPSFLPAASGHLLCPATPYLCLRKACVWAAACTKPGGSGSCREAGLNPALWMNHLQYDPSLRRRAPSKGSVSSCLTQSPPCGTPVPAAPPERACGMCPAWTGFSLENGGTEPSCMSCTAELLCLSIGMGPRGVMGTGLPHVHPPGFVPGGTCWVQDAGTGAACPSSLGTCGL